MIRVVVYPVYQSPMREKIRMEIRRNQLKKQIGRAFLESTKMGCMGAENIMPRKLRIEIARYYLAVLTKSNETKMALLNTRRKYGSSRSSIYSYVREFRKAGRSTDGVAFDESVNHGGLFFRR